jgi:hypothetical protein
MYIFWNLFFFVLKFGLMGFGAYLGVNLLFAETQTWLTHYIDVAQTLNIATYAVTIIGGIIVGYITYRIVGGIIGSIFQGSIMSSAQNQMRNQMDSMKDNFFK